MGDSYRQERIDRLFKELQYEIEVGMIKGEIEESLGFRFIVPTSKSIPGGVVHCEFLSRPIHRHSALGLDSYDPPKLRVVKA